MNKPPQPGLGLPYSPIRQAGDFYHLAGHVGVDMAAKSADPDIAKQTHQLFANLKATLATAGLSLNDVVKTTVYVTDMADFAAVNEVYATYFSEPRPARSTVAVRELPRVANVPLRVEIDAVAYKPQIGS